MSGVAYQKRVGIRRRVEDPENHERWVISYADFITLLFAFFVVMYSISSVNEGKYKVLSDTLVNVFNAKSKTLDPVQIGDQEVKNKSDRIVSLPVPGDYPSAEDYKYSVEGLFDDVENTSNSTGGDRGETSHLTKLSEQISMTFQSLISEGLMQINANENFIEIDIQSSVLFQSGSALPSEAARKIIRKVANLLKGYKNPIQVEGFTDNVPIQTDQFPSNWELSAARAAAVVRMLEALDIDPARLAAVGYGEHRPVADNDTEEGRAKNRRVALLIPRLEKSPQSNKAAPAGYKLGKGQSGMSPVDARDPVKRRQSMRKVPLKIMGVDKGGILFSSDSDGTTKNTSASAQGQQAKESSQ